MNKKSAWNYCRIDAPEDIHGALKGQYERLETYAEQMGFSVVGSSQDLGSGLLLDLAALGAAALGSRTTEDAIAAIQCGEI